MFYLRYFALLDPYQQIEVQFEAVHGAAVRLLAGVSVVDQTAAGGGGVLHQAPGQAVVLLRHAPRPLPVQPAHLLN